MTITWRKFDIRANPFAQVLRAKGIKKGDKVVHLMNNSIDWLVAFFGIVRIGVPDKRLSELVAVVIDVIPGKSLTEAEVLAFCEQLPRYKRPRIIYFGEVPRNPTGKIEKPKIRKKYTGMAEAFKI